MEFESLKPLLPQVVINTTTTNEHVTKIERHIRIVKARTRATIATLPFPKLPKLIVIKLICFVTMWLNNFPVKHGIWSPRELLVRHKLDARLHYRAPFGAYCETHDEPTPTNTMVG